jgi:HSP20 family molecular chaperone IbpA
MALFPRYVRDEFAPFQSNGLFKFMDDYANHLLSSSGRDFPQAVTSSFPRFQPKFDVKETGETYELHGELPGLEQKDVNIEFTDPQTLVIKGTTQHIREEGERPTGFIEGASEQAKLTEGESGKGKKATVEDEAGPTQSTVSATGETSTEPSTEVTQQQSEQPSSRYWVREMSRGEFSRTFAFPTRVDHDGVKASLKNGILSVVVPKAAAPQSRRINIE